MFCIFVCIMFWKVKMPTKRTICINYYFDINLERLWMFLMTCKLVLVASSAVMYIRPGRYNITISLTWFARWTVWSNFEQLNQHWIKRFVDNVFLYLLFQVSQCVRSSSTINVMKGVVHISKPVYIQCNSELLSNL